MHILIVALLSLLLVVDCSAMESKQSYKKQKCGDPQAPRNAKQKKREAHKELQKEYCDSVLADAFQTLVSLESNPVFEQANEDNMRSLRFYEYNKAHGFSVYRHLDSNRIIIHETIKTPAKQLINASGLRGKLLNQRMQEAKSRSSVFMKDKKTRNPKIGYSYKEDGEFSNALYTTSFSIEEVAQAQQKFKARLCALQKNKFPGSKRPNILLPAGFTKNLKCIDKMLAPEDELDQMLEEENS